MTMSTVTKTTAEGREDDFCGLCPTCHRITNYYNVREKHYGYCREHRFRWWFGSALFEDWEHEDEEDWQRNVDAYRDFELIDNYYHHPPTFRERLKGLRRRMHLHMPRSNNMPF